MRLSLDRSRALPFLVADGPDRSELDARVLDAHRAVLDGTTRSPEMLGWRDMLLAPDDALIESVQSVADEVRERADVLVCVGIGGSYLGAQAVIEALDPYFGKEGPEVLFAGHHLSADYHEQLLAHLEGKSVYVNVISKSGTTLEPALAFRFLRQHLEATTDDAARRIIATTDASEGILRDLADAEGYRTYVVPDSVGGRFSVLTPVGLLPIAAAGHDVRSLFYGAVGAARELSDASEAALAHPALQYAGDRYAFHERGYTVEALAVMEARLRGLGFWWQQLFGESEGKEGKGLFPVSLQYTTDLHSVGQYVQEGKRMIVETFLRVDDADAGRRISARADSPDGLGYLDGKTMGEANLRAYEGTAEAHREGGVPNWTLTLPRVDADALGEAIYFFEHAVAVSGTLLGVDPFDQPGVEAYKKKMFRLLGRE